jgi:hypothetical protein
MLEKMAGLVNSNVVVPASQFSLVLPLLHCNKDNLVKTNNNNTTSLYSFTSKGICEQARMLQGLELNEEEVAQTLREAVVLLLKRGATYKLINDGDVEYRLPGPNVRASIQTERMKNSVLIWSQHILFVRVIPLFVFCLKIFIGLFLIVSLFVIVFALIALMAVAASQRGGGGGNGGGQFFHHMHRRNRIFLPFRWLGFASSRWSFFIL